MLYATVMQTAEDVRTMIRAAFGERPVPDPATLVRDVERAMDRPGADAIRADLAGRAWPDLTPEFLAARWSAFCYLSPEGYRYYLPSLLAAALDALPETGGLTHAVVFGLRPSFWALYYAGDDRGLRERQAVFTPAQYDAVVAFLGFFFEHVPALRRLAAQGLRWGWNARESGSVAAVERYYDALYHFTYPEPEDPEAAAVCRAVRSAFAATPYPGDDRLCGSSQGDEPAEIAVEFRGVRWQEARPDLLAYQYTALSFLSDAGFRYFLPAFLVAELTGYPSSADPVFHLTHGLGRADADARFAAFTPSERAAIVRYLEYRSDDAFSAPDIRKALDDYWLPSLAGPTK